MKDQQVQRHANSLPDNSLTASGGVPVPFNKEAGAFSGSWDWGIVVDPLGPGETAECRLMLGWMITALLLLTAREFSFLGRANTMEGLIGKKA